jgi:hypothetical protein
MPLGRRIRAMWQTFKAWLSSSTQSVEVGTVADLPGHIQRLIDAPEGSLLIIEVIGQADAFLQFTASPNRIQIDHPLITRQQVEREAALRNALRLVGLTSYETRGSDGSRFLDCDAPRESRSAAILVERIFESLFRVDPSTELRFVGNGLPPAA